MNVLRFYKISSLSFQNWRVNTNLFAHHHFDELLVVDLSIAINISLTDHFINFFIGKFLTKVSHDVAKLSSGDESITVFVENLESLKDFFLRVRVFHLAGHHGKELRDINATHVLIGLLVLPPRSSTVQGGVHLFWLRYG